MAPSSNNLSSGGAPLQSKNEIIQDIGRYSEEDCRQFYQNTFGLIFSEAMRWADGDKDLAGSLTNDAYMVFFRKRPFSIHLERRARSYVYKAVRLVYYQYRREMFKRNKGLTFTNIVDEQMLNELTDQEKSGEKQEQISAFLEDLEHHLSSLEWKCLVMRYQDNIKRRDIASILHIEVEDVGKLLQAARRKARRLRKHYKF